MVKNQHQVQAQNHAEKRKSKTPAERQALKRDKIKQNSEQYAYYLEKQRELMRKKRAEMSDAKRNEKRKKESERRKELRKMKKQKMQTPVASPKAYSVNSSLSRAVNRVSKYMPKSPGKKKAVVKELAYKVKLNFNKKKKIQKGKMIAEDIKNKIRELYNRDDVSRWTPGKQEYVTTRNEIGEKIKMQKRYLQLTCDELYKVFKQEYPELVVGRSMFYSLRPVNVILSSNTPHSTCHCKYHENIILYLDALNKTSKRIPSYSSDFPDSVVCTSSTDSCYLNECNDCQNGAMFKEKYPLDDLMSEIISYDDENHSDEDDELMITDKACKGTHVTWFQWEETTNSLGYSNLAKIIHEGDFPQLYENFVESTSAISTTLFYQKKTGDFV